MGLPMELFLKTALRDFERALVQQNVYDEGHANLKRACNGALYFVRFLLEGPGALRTRPPRRPRSN